MDDTIIEQSNPVEPVEAPQPISYVTHTDDGTLDGSYHQVPPEAHARRMIVVDEATRAAWVNYRANEARDGVELVPPAPPSAPAVPHEVTMRQARLALLAAGLLGQIDAAIDSLPSPTKEEARIEWDYSSTVVRDRSLVAMIGQALGMDSAELDQLFITAAGL